ncbi:hypothetical protein C8F01DRAFT_1114149 [Mycena amicta]|nr:hypothetical protein C8F01DRAFT_1114149 [Mycena amicta]
MSTPIDYTISSRLQRVTHILFELLVISGSSFILTAALLPLFGLHPSLWTVARVTIVCTAVVVTAVEGSFGRRVDEEEQCREKDMQNPKFHLAPRIPLPWREQHKMGMAV